MNRSFWLIGLLVLSSTLGVLVGPFGAVEPVQAAPTITWDAGTQVVADALDVHLFAPGEDQLMVLYGEGTDTKTKTSLDAGSSYGAATLVVASTLLDGIVSCVSTATCYVSLDAGASCQTRKSTDFGASWGSTIHPFNPESNCDYPAIDTMRSGSNDFVLGFYQDSSVTNPFFKGSEDGGNTTTVVGDSQIATSQQTNGDISAFNETVYWTTLIDAANRVDLYRTTDSGASWAREAIVGFSGCCDPVLAGRYQDIEAVNESDVWVLYANTNGGANVTLMRDHVSTSAGTVVSDVEVSLGTGTQFSRHMDLYMHPSDNQTMAASYAYESGGTWHFEVAVTDDGWATWDTQELRTGASASSERMNTAVAISPTGQLYAAVADLIAAETTVYVGTGLEASECGTASACYLENANPFNVVATDYTGDWVYAREEGNGEIFANGNGSVFRFGVSLTLANSFYPCEDLDGGNFRYNQESRSLVTTHDNFVLAGCTVTNDAASGDNKDTSLHAMEADLSRPTEFCSVDLPLCQSNPWGDMEVQLETLATTWDFTSMWENDIGLTETDKVFRGRARDLPSDTFESPGTLYDMTMDRSPNTLHQFWVTGDFGTRGFDKSHNVILREDSLTGRAIGAYDGLVYILNAGNLSRYAWTAGDLTWEASNTTGPWSTDHSGNLKMSKDGDFLLVWTDSTISLVNLTDDNMNVTQTISQPASAAFEDVEWSFGNNYVFAVTDDGIYRFDVFDSTTWFGEDGGAGSTNPIGDTQDQFDQTGTARESEAGGGAGGASQFLGVELTGAEDAGLDAGQMAWFLGVLMIIGIGGAVYGQTKSAGFAAIAAFGGLGFAKAMNLIPTWFIVAIVFASVAVIVLWRRFS